MFKSTLIMFSNLNRKIISNVQHVDNNDFNWNIKTFQAVST